MCNLDEDIEYEKVEAVSRVLFGLYDLFFFNFLIGYVELLILFHHQFKYLESRTDRYWKAWNELERNRVKVVKFHSRLPLSYGI